MQPQSLTPATSSSITSTTYTNNTNSTLNSNNKIKQPLSALVPNTPTNVSSTTTSSSAAALAPIPTSTPIATATATIPSSNLSGFAYCAHCGEYGVKAAFYGKSKLYCSVACQSGIKKNQQQTTTTSITSGIGSGGGGATKRPYDAIITTNSTQNSVTSSSSSSLSSSASNVLSTTAITTTTTPNIPSFINETAIPTPTSTLNMNTSANTITQTITISSSSSVSSSSSSSSSSPSATSPSAHKIQKATTTAATSLTNKKFHWCDYIENENAISACVSYFKHAPLNEFWNKIEHNIKIEVPNRENEHGKSTSTATACSGYWFATVIKFAGYFAKLRFIGYENDDKYDYWMHICDQSIHAVGWSAENNIPLIPPVQIRDKIDNWKEYLINQLSGFKTLPKLFHRKVQDSLKSKFKCGMLLELIDKKRISRMKVARIIDNIGGRLRMKYEMCDDFDDFWCHQNSELIHPIGWSMLNGHEIDASENYKKTSLDKIVNNAYESTECNESMFKKIPQCQSILNPVKRFKPTMKLEAIDPLNLSTICVATVGKVLKNNYLMISIDGFNTVDGSDMFCYHQTSSSIFPAGFCKQNNIPLQPPYDYKGDFDWQTYLRETNSEFAPTELFYKSSSRNPFRIGMKLESVDLMDPKMLCVATVVSVVDRLIKLNFDGWDSEFDQWVDFESCDIYPVGWCELVSYQLEPPRNLNDSSQSLKKKSKHKQKRSLSSKKTSTSLDTSK